MNTPLCIRPISRASVTINAKYVPPPARTPKGGGGGGRGSGAQQEGKSGRPSPFPSSKAGRIPIRTGLGSAAIGQRTKPAGEVTVSSPVKVTLLVRIWWRHAIKGCQFHEETVCWLAVVMAMSVFPGFPGLDLRSGDLLTCISCHDHILVLVLPVGVTVTYTDDHWRTDSPHTVLKRVPR